ncbi:MAG: IS200/IS605 family transposase [Acidobacteria bacterium]|nr:IS200/IS605 family transposase [Acidobacteriota bacterium]MCB9399438.1 IS200/IS605 family transposase [Acidobacteriota bacterium]
MSGTYSNLLYHIIFCTKNRYPMIHGDFEAELYRYITGIIQGEKGQLLAIDGVEDHIHLVVKLKPSHDIPDLLKRTKAHSTIWINNNDKVDGRFSWQKGYGIFSVSASQLSKVIAYVRNQKEHHRNQTSRDELIGLLLKHDVMFDPHYLDD